MLGACVPPEVGDAYCGLAGRIGGPTDRGCAFRPCGADERLDATTGHCVPRVAVAPGPAACADGGVPIVEQRRVACVAAGATCPRGTRPQPAAAGAQALLCASPVRCPPGSLPEGKACRSVVSAGAGQGPKIDVGAWAALALGADGGPGSEDLCRPLALRPDVFGVPPGGVADVALRVTLAIPDQDVTRVSARTRASARPDAAHPWRLLGPEAEALVDRSVATLVEPLRGLGGEATAAIVELHLECKVSGF